VLVDAVVTDKKGNYIRDLAQNEFKVFEDNKEQSVSSFSTGADAEPTQGRTGNAVSHFVFRTIPRSAAPDQIQARKRRTKFIAANAGAPGGPA